MEVGKATRQGQVLVERRRDVSVFFFFLSCLPLCPRYSGDWDQDIMQGQGTYTFSNGDTYVGQYVKVSLSFLFSPLFERVPLRARLRALE